MPQAITAGADWQTFLQQLEEIILPIYRQHELTFDGAGIHGRLHICRAVLLAEYMARFYIVRLGLDLDLYAVRTATAFHDSARQGNGVDVWEADSAQLCAAYVCRTRPEAGERYAAGVGDLIEKHGPWDACRQIVHDADTLEIMRPYCLNGPAGFRREELRFLGPSAPGAVKDAEQEREGLISEAWAWIAHIEWERMRMTTAPSCTVAVLAELACCRDCFPRLATLL